MKINFTVSCLLTGATIAAHAQNAGPATINAAGGSNTIAGKTYEFSIGEMALVHTASGPNIIVTNGVLQPVTAVTGLADVHYLFDNLKVYPNPSDNLVYLQPDLGSGGRLSYNLYDALGRIMLEGAFKLATGKEKQTIYLGQLAAGSYMLHISFNDKDKRYSASFNVQKTN